MNKLFFFFLSILLFVFVSCGSNSNKENTNNGETNDNEVVNEENNVSDFAITSKENFLQYVLDEQGMPKTFENQYMSYLFFRADGTMAGGGASGESSMWEGNWDFNGGKLLIQITMQPTEGQTISGDITVEMFPDNGSIILNGEEYYPSQY